MKIKIVDQGSNKPLSNTKVQLQVKGQDSGFLTLTTDAKGFVQVDDKYQGQQVTSTTGAGGQGQWITAKEGAQIQYNAQYSAKA